MDLVALDGLVCFVELGPMRKRNNAAAIPVLQLHAITKIIRFRPCSAAIVAAQDYAVRHGAIWPTSPAGIVPGNATVHDYDLSPGQEVPLAARDGALLVDLAVPEGGLVALTKKTEQF